MSKIGASTERNSSPFVIGWNICVVVGGSGRTQAIPFKSVMLR